MPMIRETEQNKKKLIKTELELLGTRNSKNDERNYLVKKFNSLLKYVNETVSANKHLNLSQTDVRKVNAIISNSNQDIKELDTQLAILGQEIEEFDRQHRAIQTRTQALDKIIDKFNADQKRLVNLHPILIKRLATQEINRILEKTSKLGFEMLRDVNYSLTSAYTLYATNLALFDIQSYNRYNRGDPSRIIDIAYKTFKSNISRQQMVASKKTNEKFYDELVCEPSEKILVFQLQCRTCPVLSHINNDQYEYNVIYSDDDGAAAYRFIRELIVRHLTKRCRSTTPTQHPLLIYTSSYTIKKHQLILDQVVKAIDELAASNREFSRYKNEIVIINDMDNSMVRRSSVIRKVVNTKYRETQADDAQRTFKHIDFYDSNLHGKILNKNRLVKAHDKTSDKVFNIFTYPVPSLASELSTKLEDKWWFKYFIKSPKCSRRRLYQITGTCWFNTNLNEMILGKHLKQLLVSKYFTLYETNAKQQSLFKLYYSLFDTDSCPRGNSKEIKDMLYAIVQQFAVYGDSVHSETNIIKNLLARTLAMPEDIGYDAVEGMKKIFGYMFDTSEYEFLTGISLSELNNLGSGVQSTSLVIVYGAAALYFEDNTSEVPRSITANGNTYVLDSAGISNKGHAIVGFFCGSVPYVYDSNNIIAQTNWPRSDFTGYYDAHWNHFGDPLTDMCYLHFTMFVRL